MIYVGLGLIYLSSVEYVFEHLELFVDFFAALLSFAGFSILLLALMLPGKQKTCE